MKTLHSLESRTSQANDLEDMLIADFTAFQQLTDLQIAAPSLDEADDILFLQNYSKIFPLSFRSFSIHSESGQHATSQEHHVPQYGDFLWGMDYAIHLHEGMVAAKKKNVSHTDQVQIEKGYTSSDDTNAKIDRSQVDIVSSTTNADSNFEAKKIGMWWMQTHGDEHSKQVQTAGGVGLTWKFRIYDGSAYATTSPSDKTWYYVASVEVDTQADPNEIYVNLEQARVYTNDVAEGFHHEPYHYALGYTMPKSVRVENEDVSKLYEVNGEVSYFRNRVHRPIERELEDEELAHVYVDEMVHRQYRDPTDPHRLLTPREKQQRISRMPQAIYSVLQHPFKHGSEAIPANMTFGKKIQFVSNMHSPAELLVFPDPSYTIEDTYARPKDSDNKHLTNEDIRRGKQKLKTQYMDKNDKDLWDMRMEIFVATVDDEERKQVESAKISKVTRQPQTRTHKLTHKDHYDSSGGNKLIHTTGGWQMQGYITEFLVYARQEQRIKDNKLFDLRAWVNPTRGIWESALYTVSFKYDNVNRTVQRADNQGTSDLQAKHFYKRMPKVGVEGGIHLLPGSAAPGDHSYAGVFFVSKSTEVHFDFQVPNRAFLYEKDDGSTVKTDLRITVLGQQFQIINFTPKGVFRSHTVESISMAK